MNLREKTQHNFQIHVYKFRTFCIFVSFKKKKHLFSCGLGVEAPPPFYVFFTPSLKHLFNNTLVIVQNLIINYNILQSYLKLLVFGIIIIHWCYDFSIPCDIHVKVPWAITPATQEVLLCSKLPNLDVMSLMIQAFF